MILRVLHSCAARVSTVLNLCLSVGRHSVRAPVAIADETEFESHSEGQGVLPRQVRVELFADLEVIVRLVPRVGRHRDRVPRPRDGEVLHLGLEPQRRLAAVDLELGHLDALAEGRHGHHAPRGPPLDGQSGGPELRRDVPQLRGDRGRGVVRLQGGGEAHGHALGAVRDGLAAAVRGVRSQGERLGRREGLVGEGGEPRPGGVGGGGRHGSEAICGAMRKECGSNAVLQRDVRWRAGP
ncbi:hypothetical protein DFJ74DRAFT_688445 [Hyaloraphidium curvatum]|nr:hypothetical protein DFJ74DRAFT_688445 [Hyaloraphidium curvatum]